MDDLIPQEVGVAEEQLLPFNPELVYAQALYDLIDEDMKYPYWD